MKDHEICGRLYYSRSLQVSNFLRCVQKLFTFYINYGNNYSKILSTISFNFRQSSSTVSNKNCESENLRRLEHIGHYLGICQSMMPFSGWAPMALLKYLKFCSLFLHVTLASWAYDSQWCNSGEIYLQVV